MEGTSMNFAPREEISSMLGQSAGSLGGGLQRLAEAKMQHLEQEYQRRQQLRQMFENQQIQQAQKEGLKKLYTKGGHVSDADAELLADVHLKDPVAATKVYEWLGRLKAQPGETHKPFEFKDTNAEAIARQGMLNKNAIELAKIGLGEKELAYKTGYDEKAFAQREKELSQKQAKEEQMLKHIAFKEGMDQKNYELKSQQLAQNHKLEREKLDLEKKKAREMGGQNAMHAAVDNRAAYEFNKKYMEEARNKRRAAREADTHYQVMEQLNNSDKLINPALYSTMKTLKLDFPFLVGKYAEIYGKEQAGLLGGLKDIFGSRVTNFDLGQFQKGLPTLENTKEGRSVMLNNLKVANEAKKLEADAIDSIIEEHDGKAPWNLPQLVDKKIGKQLDELYKELKTGLESSKNQSQLSGKKEFKELPPASEYKDKTLIDPKSGKQIKSNGKSWIEVK